MAKRPSASEATKFNNTVLTFFKKLTNLGVFHRRLPNAHCPLEEGISEWIFLNFCFDQAWTAGLPSLGGRDHSSLSRHDALEMANCGSASLRVHLTE
jgi:hypothetical protein